MTSRIIVADDHPLFRAAISHLLDRMPLEAGITEVDSFAALEQQLSADTRLPALVLLDLKLPDTQGLDGLLRLKTQYAELPVVIISAYDDENIIQQTRQYGASGFISKSLEMEEIANAISRVFEGELVFPALLPSPAQVASPAINELTPAQMKVLQLLREGRPSKSMAASIGVTEATIKAHLTTIFRKLGVKNRTQAVIAANQLDLPGAFPGETPD